ncbi:hypothetical protein AMELA_G00144910 [Ameiurus melas]|uniref:Uncharacterized protein n=1 Tax=Ameiurus melas TaxID=219545 RepID=A0A7J6AFW1_AMEME|nr:hypothetical protein AMELA_G00144910 [Ameiurus melas]
MLRVCFIVASSTFAGSICSRKPLSDSCSARTPPFPLSKHLLLGVTPQPPSSLFQLPSASPNPYTPTNIPSGPLGHFGLVAFFPKAFLKKRVCVVPFFPNRPRPVLHG